MQNLDALRYVVLPGNSADLHDDLARRRHEKAFAFWLRFWPRVFADNGADSSLQPDGFSRFQFVTCLFAGDEPVAQHCYSRFDLSSDAARMHSYIAGSFNAAFFDDPRIARCRVVMSLEVLAVSPEWRQRHTGRVSLASILVQAGLRIAASQRVDAAIGVARDRVVPLVQALGGAVVADGGLMHNTPVALMAVYPERFASRLPVSWRPLADRLWREREQFVAIRRRAVAGSLQQAVAA